MVIGDMHTFINFNLSKFRNDLPNVAIRNSIQTDEIFEIFPISSFLSPDISETNKVKNLKQTLKVAHIIHMQSV